MDNYSGSYEGAGIYVDGTSSTEQRKLETTSPKIYNNHIVNNRATNGAGIYIEENARPVNAAGTVWKNFNAPNATITFVENTTTKNNTYRGNSIIQVLTASRDVLSQEGADIYFNAEYKTPTGTLTLSPATATGNAGEKITFKATYTINSYTYEGSTTFKLPAEINITTGASVTIDNETKRFLTVEEIIDQHTVLLTELINGTEEQIIVFDFIYNGALKEETYNFKMTFDADGEGTLYTVSDESGASLTIPPQYAAPDVEVFSPVNGMEFATTTVTFTWAATGGVQINNTMGREAQGISGYIVAFAGRNDEWASVTINDANTKEYATDTLSYGEDYKWYVKAIGANGKTTTTPDATFMTTYRVRDLGVEGTAFTITDETSWNEYAVSVDTKYLPARFTGETRFSIVLNGTVYDFEQSTFETNVYTARIPYVSGTSNIPSEEDIRDGKFES
jgi:hypothetical protein